MTEIIVEICQNHNGKVELIKELLETARESGAQWAKLQCIYSEDLARRDRFEQGEFKNGQATSIRRPFGAEFERLKSLDLDPSVYQKAVTWCKELGLKSMVTVFSLNRVEEMASLGWDAVKVASYDCASPTLLRALSKKFKRLIVSTGATHPNEVEEASKILQGVDHSFLHCTTIYPTPPEAVNLQRMDWLKKFEVPVGFSDHSPIALTGVNASLIAMWKGAAYVERHFTVLEIDETRDGPVSIRPHHLQQMAEFALWPKEQQFEYIQAKIPNYQMYIGDGNLDLTQAELLNRDYYRGRFAWHNQGKVINNWDT